MKITTIFFLSFCLFIGVLYKASFFEHISKKVETLHNLEKITIEKLRENLELKAQVADLKRTHKELEIKLAHFYPKKASRKIASVEELNSQSDIEIYKWGNEELLALGNKRISEANYKDAIIYFEAIIKNNKFDNKEVKAEAYFKSGLAIYESETDYRLAKQRLSYSIEHFPESKYVKSSKLWLALTHLKLDEVNSFKEIMEEFNRKYRNSEEWEILSGYYENLKFKN